MVELDRDALLRALEAGEARLAAKVEHVNKLNVYPVPDGDTGTNMLHTMRASVMAARKAEGGATELAAAAAHGSLMGARGNSGVILSQILAGVKVAFAGKRVVSERDVAQAFARGRELAYQAVPHPVEGTILTAIRAMSEAVGDGSAHDPATMLDRAVAAGREAVLRTPELLPVLKRAGVVDAGAQGLVYIIEGMADAVAGRVSDTVRSAEEEAAIAAGAPREPRAARGGAWGYDVQFLVSSPARAVTELRTEMLRYGLDDPSLSCVLVVGDDSLVKVHVHTRAPHEILRIGLSAGPIQDVVVEDLDAMVAERERETGVTVTQEEMDVRPLAAVAFVSGEGLARVSRSLGAFPIRGVDTPRPSVGEIVTAIDAAPGEAVVVLPNDRDVIPAAQRAAEASNKRVRVVATRTMPQGMAALVAFDPQGDLDAVARSMEEAARGARTIEVARSVRDADVDGVRVRDGEHLALVDGKAVGAASTPEDALALAARAVGRAELCTLYLGADAKDPDAARELLRAACGCEVEVVDGGQPHYPYIVSTE